MLFKFRKNSLINFRNLTPIEKTHHARNCHGPRYVYFSRAIHRFWTLLLLTIQPKDYCTRKRLSTLIQWRIQGEQIRPWSKFSLAIDIDPSNEEISMRYFETY